MSESPATAATIAAGISGIGARVLGRWEWQPPAWVLWARRRVAQGYRYLASDVRRATAVVLVIAGVLALFRGQLLWGIVLIVVGLLVGPGGVSVFT